MKIGRNQPCPCGSGAKYKKCHLGRHYSPFQNPRVPPDVLEAANRFSKPPIESFKQDGFLLGRPFIDIIF